MNGSRFSTVTKGGTALIWGQSWTDVFQAFGTVGAVVTALMVALGDYLGNRKALRRQRREKENETASLVSAWVETEYVSAGEGARYDKISKLHIANEGSEPVFDLNVVVGLGPPWRQVGPLSAPVPITTLSSRRERIFDITAGILAHEVGEGFIDFSEPRARISFTDRRGVRWYRDFDGELFEDLSGEEDPSQKIDEQVPFQMGPASLLNPMFVAVGFMDALTKDDAGRADIDPFLDPHASGFSRMSDAEVGELKKSFAGYGLPAHVWYRTDRVAYVRVIRDRDVPEERPTHDGIDLLLLAVLTLTFRKNLGWRIFSIGPTMPNYIYFENGETEESVRSYLDDLE